MRTAPLVNIPLVRVYSNFYHKFRQVVVANSCNTTHRIIHQQHRETPFIFIRRLFQIHWYIAVKRMPGQYCDPAFGSKPLSLHTYPGTWDDRGHTIQWQPLPPGVCPAQRKSTRESGSRGRDKLHCASGPAGLTLVTLGRDTPATAPEATLVDRTAAILSECM